MVVYKWVYKKDNKYYSLMNYGFCRLNKKILTKQPFYEISKVYINSNRSCEDLKKQFFKHYSYIPKFLKSGFYFWVKNLPINKNLKKHMIKLGADINAILKCDINENDVLSFERNRQCIRANKFRVLEEIISE